MRHPGLFACALRLVATTVLVLATAVTTSIAQEDENWPVTEGAKGAEANGVVRADIRDLCATLYPSDDETVTRRSSYPDWVKQLLCNYIVGDFTTETSRDAYVKDVLTALRENSAGAWRFANRAPVEHIVTVNPAFWDKPNRDEAGRVKKIKKSSIRRSLRKPSSAAIGIHQSLFPTHSARNRSEADDRIPKAEDLMLRILGMAIVADLLAGTDAAISKSTAKARIKTGLKEFQRTILTAAAMPKIGGTDFGPRPARAAAPEHHDAYTAPGEDVGKNVIIRTPEEGGKSILITEVPEDGKIGLTRTASGVDLSQDIDPLEPRDVESIDPEYRFKKNYLLKTVVQTFIVIETFYGVPDEKSVVLRVMGTKGQDCTSAIRAHENQHVDQFWAVWREQVVNAIYTDLLNRKFKNMKESIVRIYQDDRDASISGTKSKLVYLIVLAEFIFPGDKGSSAKAARNQIRATYGTDSQAGITDRFLKETDLLADAYHTEVQVGLDDNCNPVKDRALARRSFGTLERAKSKRRLNVKDFFPKRK